MFHNRRSDGPVDCWPGLARDQRVYTGGQRALLLPVVEHCYCSDAVLVCGGGVPLAGRVPHPTGIQHGYTDSSKRAQESQREDCISAHLVVQQFLCVWVPIVFHAPLERIPGQLHHWADALVANQDDQGHSEVLVALPHRVYCVRLVAEESILSVRFHSVGFSV